MTGEVDSSRQLSKQLFRIRPATEQDFDAVLGIYNHYVSHTAVTFDVESQTRELRRAWFDAFSDTHTPRYRLLVAEEEVMGNEELPQGLRPCSQTPKYQPESARVVGYAASFRFKPKAAYDSSVEVSVYCHPQATGKGMGSQLYRKLHEVLRAAATHRAYALITLPNAESIRLHERLGYKLVGTLSEAGYKFGKYWDVAIFELDFG